jgi:hypothetical protein
MIIGNQPSETNRKWLPTLTARDLRLMSVLAPFIWVVAALAAYLAFANGRVGEGIAHAGMLLVLFSAMVGPYFWKIVEHSDLTLCKVLNLITALGVLTMAAGWLIRLAA